MNPNTHRVKEITKLQNLIDKYLLFEVSFEQYSVLKRVLEKEKGMIEAEMNNQSLVMGGTGV